MANKDDAVQGREAQQLQSLVDDDAFLTELSLGKDPSQGKDELAGLLLELRGDVDKPMPKAPELEGGDGGAAVSSLSAARARRRRPLMHGFVGAAAATLMIAGSGTVIFNAGPDSPLSGVHDAVFGSGDAESVELAGKLEEINSRVDAGDMDGTRQLLEEARKLVRHKEATEESGEVLAKKAPAERVTATVTQQAEPSAPPAPAPAQEPEIGQPQAAEPRAAAPLAAQAATVTVTATETAYVTTTGSDSSTQPSTSTSSATEPTEPTDSTSPNESTEPTENEDSSSNSPTP